MDKEKYRQIQSVFITVRALYSQKMCKSENYESFKATLQPLYSELKASAKENNNEVLISQQKQIIVKKVNEVLFSDLVKIGSWQAGIDELSLLFGKSP